MEKELILAIIFIFRHAYTVIVGSNNGNFDLLYLAAIIIFFQAIMKKRYIIIKSLLALLPYIGLVLFEILFSPISLSAQKVIITLTKTFLCILIMYWFVYNYVSIDLNKFVLYATKLLVILTGFAFIFNQSVLWIHNDTVNVYTTTRLRLFALEPTYLALFISVMLTYIFYCVMQKGKVSNENLFVIIALLVIMLLSAGMGGIATLAIGVVVILIYYSFINFCKGKMNIWVFLCVVFVPIIFIGLLFTDLPIVERLFAVLQGKDSSFNYRFVKGSLGMQNFLEYTNGIGIGMGCLNTEVGRSYLKGWNIEAVIVSSIMYFIAENGYLGMIFLIAAGIYLLSRARKSIFFVALCVMLIAYQFLGGYFTDPFCWLCYGMILARPIEGERKARRKIRFVWR